MYHESILGPSTRPLPELLSWLCPTLDVNVTAHQWNTKPELVIIADDWLKMSGEKLLDRTWSSFFWPREFARLNLNWPRKYAGRNVTVIRAPNGEIVGRASIVPYDASIGRQSGEGIVTVGGFRAMALVGIAGALKGISKRASRDNAEVIVEPRQLKKWANGQVKLIQRAYERPEDQALCAVVVELCGGSANALKIVTWGGKWFSSDELAETRNLPLRILLIGEGDVKRAEEKSGSIRLRKEVFVTPVGIVASSIYASERDSWQRFSFHRKRERNPLHDLISRGLAKAWGVDEDEVKEGSINLVRIGDSEYDDIDTSAHYFLHPSIDDFDDEDF